MDLDRALAAPSPDQPFGVQPSMAVFHRATRIARALFTGGESLVVLVEHGIAWRSRDFGVPLGDRDWAADLVMSSGELLWIEDGRDDPRCAGEALLLQPPFLRSWIAAPIRLEDGAIPGVLAVVHTQPQPFNRSKAARLQDLADFVADEWARAKAAQARQEAEHALDTAHARHVTELKAALDAAERSEERLGLALTLSEVHVWELDYVRRLLFKAGAEDSFFEQPQTYRDLYRDIYLTIDARDRDLVRESWRRHVEEGTPHHPQYRIARTDGKEVWVQSAIAYFEENGRPIRLVGAIRNITAAKQAEQRLVQAIEAAEAANQAKSQFLATMSHEIRTPLNGVLGMAQAMAADELTAGQRGRLEVVRESGQSLLAVLNDVLDISKIEAGKLELESAEFDLAAAAEGVTHAFVALAEQKGIRLELQVAPAARGVCLGDATRVRQVLYNLVSNAVKFTDAGSVRVAVTRRGGWVRLRVSDTGIGIASEAVQRLFQKFEQVDASTTRRYGGSGLGLSICRQLVELMSGQIEVKSQPGSGATFTATLRLPRIAAGQPAHPAAAPPPAELDAPPLRVLAAEDNAINQLVLKTLLGQIGIEPTLVGDGEAALEAWEREAWDVILMDVQMPRLDGPAATRAIRRREAALGRPRTPIVALTANAMTHQVDEYLASGMDDFVAKPIEVAQLFAVLLRVTEGADAAAVATA